ncbi:MAG: WS/DGAT domain-containing protein, partial [Sulfuritalea sp.]|nr:WS/DGAT domain-containing protein [Sulfuritalea sp.]
RMSGYWPLSIVEHGVGLNITLMDYAGTLFLGFVVARTAVPDARQLADDFLAAFDEMKQMPGKRQTPPRTAAGSRPVKAATSRKKPLRARSTVAGK